MSNSTTFSTLLDRLETAASELPSELNRDWFAAEVFSCRSSEPLDYLTEIRTNITRLQNLDAENDAYGWLCERVEQQLGAFTQALFRAKLPRQAYHQDHAASKRNNLSALYKELAQHHEYERRLEEHLREAPPQNVIRCQQRLLRCQRAIRGIEEKIRRAEG